MVIGAPTGDNKEAGTINATAVYDDNVLLTCHALAADFIERGTVDTTALDAMVPPKIIPERIEKVPLLEDVEVERVDLQRQPDGTFLAVTKTVIEKRQVQDWTPIYDAQGNGIDAVQEPAFDKPVLHRQQVIPRRNEVGHLFKAMVDGGFDPRNPAQYFARLKADQALPGMPTRADWRHGQFSTGEMHCRLWLATEMLALAAVALHERIQRLEAR